MKTLLLFSVLCLISIFNLKAQVPNNGFETWENDVDGNWNPKFWTTSNSTPDTSVRPYTPAYAGNFSMQVSSTDLGVAVIPGMAYINYLSHQRPTQMTICMKSTVATGDQILVYYSSWRNDTMIAAVGNCSFHIDSTMSQFHCLTFPITHTNALIPDTAQVMIIAGNLSSAQAGTSVIVDEITLSGNDNGISETLNDNSVEFFPNPAIDHLNIESKLSSMNGISIMDILGREVYYSKSELKTQSISLQCFPSGIYFIKVQMKDGSVTVRKFVKE
ncbi:hypothetical protein LBMAG27_22880 [Bacteroidota bacterium]|nr:hypothetical protein LBMAG27_22880 [Bacteroidota bacterium]